MECELEFGGGSGRVGLGLSGLAREKAGERSLWWSWIFFKGRGSTLFMHRVKRGRQMWTVRKVGRFCRQ